MPRKRSDSVVSLIAQADADLAAIQKRIAAAQARIDAEKQVIESCEQEIAETKAAKRFLDRHRGGKPARAARGRTEAGTEPAGKRESMAALIRRYAVGQADRFTPAMLIDLIRRESPAVFAKMPANYIPTTLWKLANGKKTTIRIVNNGGPGGTNEYEAIKSEVNAAA